MKDELWAFDWKFWALIVVIVWIATGCATVIDHREHLLWNDCAGNSRSSYVEVRTGFPPIACPALAMEHDAPLLALHLGLELPLACTVMWRSHAIIIAPPGAPEWMMEHERRHIRGGNHPPLLPFAWYEQCPEE